MKIVYITIKKRINLIQQKKTIVTVQQYNLKVIEIFEQNLRPLSCFDIGDLYKGIRELCDPLVPRL